MISNDSKTHVFNKIFVVNFHGFPLAERLKITRRFISVIMALKYIENFFEFSDKFVKRGL